VTTLADDVDEAYMQRLETLIVNQVLFPRQNLAHYLHADSRNGGVIIKPLLKRLGFNFQFVEEQTVSMGFSDREIP